MHSFIEGYYKILLQNVWLKHTLHDGVKTTCTHSYNTFELYYFRTFDLLLNNINCNFQL